MDQVGLRLHHDKTKIVYSKDEQRRLDTGLGDVQNLRGSCRKASERMAWNLRYQTTGHG
jgi:hypothetical protein